MTPAQLEALAALGTTRTLARGRRLVREGEQLSCVYLLTSGQVKVSRSSISGAEVILALRGAPEIIGLMSVVDGGTASATVEVLEAGEASAVATSRFTEFLLRNPDLMLEQMRRLAAAVRESDLRRIHLSTLDLTARLARCLLEASDHGTVALSQEELAGMCGATREAVARILRGFRDDGWIRTERRRIEIVRRRELVQLAGIEPMVV